MTTAFLDVDVRPILPGGGEPFGKLMEALDALEPAQRLRVGSTVSSLPLGRGRCTPQPSTTTDAAWPPPAKHLDNRDLDRPEPMVRILAAVETMREGETLSTLLCREPVFLYPELAKPGHKWRGGFESDGSTSKVMVRVGVAQRALA